MARLILIFFVGLLIFSTSIQAQDCAAGTCDPEDENCLITEMPSELCAWPEGMDAAGRFEFASEAPLQRILFKGFMNVDKGGWFTLTVFDGTGEVIDYREDICPRRGTCRENVLSDPGIGPLTGRVQWTYCENPSCRKSVTITHLLCGSAMERLP